MGREQRKELLRRIEDLRDSRVVAYVTGDRAPTSAQIGDDAVRPMYEHLREIKRVNRLDLFIYSRGGAIDVPWRIATALRTVADEWNILVPFRAGSAATLLALGADHVIMGPQGELGPIDPIMNIQRLVTAPGAAQGTFVQETVNVEDIMAYVRFIKERAGLTDQSAMAGSLDRLAERLDAVVLGNAYRTHSHIRDVARRMLLSRDQPPSEQATATIIETLAERVYAHGHAIGRREAEGIGLPVQDADGELDQVMWDLLSAYEEDLKLLEPLDPYEVVRDKDVHREDAVIAVIESAWGVHEFTGQVEVRAKRQIPPNLNVTLNLNLQFPPQVDAGQLPGALQNLLQQAQQALLQAAQQAVQEAMKTQAPLVGLEAGFRGGRWRRSR